MIAENPAARRGPTLAELPPPPAGRSGWPWTEGSPEAPPRAPGGRPWPRITVVTPSYNQAAFLEETIRSVLLQGYPNLEYIVMDGGSSDGSPAIIARYAPWLAHWQSRRDAGQSDAIASGFAMATGEVLAWLNSDDVYRPGALARVGRFFAARPRVVFAVGDVNFTDQGGAVIARMFVTGPNHFLTANAGIHHWPQQGSFWRRGTYAQVGGVDRTLRFCMDRDLFLRLSAAGPSRRIPGPPLADFRQHEGAKTATIAGVQREEGYALMRRYGSAAARRRYGALRLLWWAWHKPAKMRYLLNRRFGWEL